MGSQCECEGAYEESEVDGASLASWNAFPCFLAQLVLCGGECEGGRVQQTMKPIHAAAVDVHS